MLGPEARPDLATSRQVCDGPAAVIANVPNSAYGEGSQVRPSRQTGWADRRARRLRSLGSATRVDAIILHGVPLPHGRAATTIRVSRDTHARVTRLAAERHETIDETVRSALRALRQTPWRATFAEGSPRTRPPGWMLTPGDVVELRPRHSRWQRSRTARPAIVVTAARVLRGGPNVVQVVPLTRTIRTSSTDLVIEPDLDTRLLRPPRPSASTCAPWPPHAFKTAPAMSDP